MSSIPGTQDEEIAYRFGPLLLARRHPVLRQYLHKEERKILKFLNSLNAYEGERISARREYTGTGIVFIRESAAGNGRRRLAWQILPLTG